MTCACRCPNCDEVVELCKCPRCENCDSSHSDGDVLYRYQYGNVSGGITGSKTLTVELEDELVYLCNECALDMAVITKSTVLFAVDERE